MRVYDELTTQEQAQAEEKALNNLLSAVTEGAVRFNDELNGDDLQARVDAAFDEAEAMHTPWFSHEYIMDTCEVELRGMAQCDAEAALYPGRGEYIIRL